MASDQLVHLLHELQGELQVRNNPERQALAKLRPNRYGWTENPYAEEALRIFEALRRQFPDDLQTVHHLAIMYHARGFDREQSHDPSQADADWKRALELWHRLWTADGFWESWARRMDDPNVPMQVRAAWPEQLLQVHFDIAFDEQCKHYRARQHIALALGSPFSSDVKHKVRLRSYERATGHLPPAVWEATTFDAETLEPAVDAIIKYLKVDEDFRPALEDLLALLSRRQTGHVQQANADAAPEDFRQRLQAVWALSSKYDAYILRLEHCLSQLEAAQIELKVLSDLILWHSRTGQALRILEQNETAAAHYQRAFTIAMYDKSDTQRQEKMRHEWLSCVLLAARTYAAGDQASEQKARELLNGITSEQSLPPMCLMLRASTHMLLKEFDAAEQDCYTALELLYQEQDELSYDTDEVSQRLESNCWELIDMITRIRRQKALKEKLDKAKEAIQNDRWDLAINLLDEGAQIDPESTIVFFLRAQCFLKKLELDQARADLAMAENLAGTKDDEEILGALHHLQRNLNALQQQVDLYGGPQSFRLQQQATVAFNDSKPERAVDLLRQALSSARPGRNQKLKEELAICLDVLAVRKTNEAIELLETNR